MQTAYPQFQAQGVALAAISIDGVEDAARMADHVEADFLVLADPDAEVARLYEVFDLLGDGVAAPATFIIGKRGITRWRHVGKNVADRPSANEILKQLREAVQ